MTVLSIALHDLNESDAIGTKVSRILSFFSGVVVIVTNNRAIDRAAHVSELGGAKAVAHAYGKHNVFIIESGAYAVTASETAFLDADLAGTSAARHSVQSLCCAQVCQQVR